MLYNGYNGMLYNGYNGMLYNGTWLSWFKVIVHKDNFYTIFSACFCEVT